MASGLPYTIIKPGGLLSTEGGRSLLIAGHDDELQHARCVQVTSRRARPSRPPAKMTVAGRVSVHISLAQT